MSGVSLRQGCSWAEAAPLFEGLSMRSVVSLCRGRPRVPPFRRMSVNNAASVAAPQAFLAVPCRGMSCRAVPLPRRDSRIPTQPPPTPPAAACGGGAAGPFSCRFEAPRCHLRDANPALPAAYGALPEPRRRGRRCCGCSALRHPRRLRAVGGSAGVRGEKPQTHGRRRRRRG